MILNKFLYEEEDKKDKYFYSKFHDIYATEERKRYNRRYIQNQQMSDLIVFNEDLKRDTQISKIKNTFIGTKNKLIKLGVTAYRDKVDKEKEDRMNKLNHYLKGTPF